MRKIVNWIFVFSATLDWLRSARAKSCIDLGYRQKNNLSQMNVRTRPPMFHEYCDVPSRRLAAEWKKGEFIQYSILIQRDRIYFFKTHWKLFRHSGRNNTQRKRGWVSTRPDPVNNMRTFHSLVNLDSCQIPSINYWLEMRLSTSLIQQKPAIRSLTTFSTYHQFFFFFEENGKTP